MADDEDIFSYSSGATSFGSLTRITLSDDDEVDTALDLSMPRAKKRKRGKLQKLPRKKKQKISLADDDDIPLLGPSASSGASLELNASSSSSSSVLTSGPGTICLLDSDDDDDDVLLDIPTPTRQPSESAIKRREMLRMMELKNEISRAYDRTEPVHFVQEETEESSSMRITFRNMLEPGHDTILTVAAMIPLRVALANYCRIFSKDPDEFEMRYKGLKIDGSRCARDYALMDGEEITLRSSDHTENLLSLPSRSSSRSTSNGAADQGGATTGAGAAAGLTVTVSVQGKAGTQAFKIAMADPLIKLRDAYARAFDLDASKLLLQFDGAPVTAADTASALDIEDEDVLDVHFR